MEEKERIDAAEKKIALLVKNEGKMIKLLEELTIKTLTLEKRMKRIENILVAIGRQK